MELKDPRHLRSAVKTGLDLVRINNNFICTYIRLDQIRINNDFTAFYM